MEHLQFLPEKIDKSWGYELIRVNNKEEDYCSKILYINAGAGTSMHYHLKKKETWYIQQGSFQFNSNVELGMEVPQQ